MRLSEELYDLYQISRPHDRLNQLVLEFVQHLWYGVSRQPDTVELLLEKDALAIKLTDPPLPSVSIHKKVVSQFIFLGPDPFFALLG